MSLAVLLDTHALLWWLHQPGSLSRRASDAIGDGANEVFVSPVSAMEIATKNRNGALEFATPLVDDFATQIALEGFKELPVTVSHAMLAGNLLVPHKDPWDRLLAAQARLERLRLITRDQKMALFDVEMLW